MTARAWELEPDPRTDFRVHFDNGMQWRVGDVDALGALEWARGDAAGRRPEPTLSEMAVLAHPEQIPTMSNPQPTAAQNRQCPKWPSGLIRAGAALRPRGVFQGIYLGDGLIESGTGFSQVRMAGLRRRMAGVPQRYAHWTRR